MSGETQTSQETSNKAELVKFTQTIDQIKSEIDRRAKEFLLGGSLKGQHHQGISWFPRFDPKQPDNFDYTVAISDSKLGEYQKNVSIKKSLDDQNPLPYEVQIISGDTQSNSGNDRPSRLNFTAFKFNDMGDYKKTSSDKTKDTLTSEDIEYLGYILNTTLVDLKAPQETEV